LLSIGKGVWYGFLIGLLSFGLSFLPSYTQEFKVEKNKACKWLWAFS